MERFDRLLRLLRELRLAPPWLIFVFILFQFALPVANIAAVVPTPPSAVSGRLGLAVAYADFDGDSQPDIAGVQVGRAGAYETEYWIQLRLSAVGSGELALLAPSGGLELDARDVNGDSFPDLVVTTRWLQEPVAVYLNDGRGGFSRVDLARFPSAFATTEAQWNVPAGSEIRAAEISQLPRAEIYLDRLWYPDPVEQEAATCSLRSVFAKEPLSAPHFGRAPPLALL